MSKTIEIKFFNSFLAKKTLHSLASFATWCGDPANPEFYPAFPVQANNTTQSAIDKCWYIEESRIYGGFNEDEVDLGVKAYLENDEENNNRSSNSLIYSGILNTRTGINQTNVFSVAEDITKSVDPRYGDIQRLYAEDSNMLIFQEAKVNAVLVDKDALYTAEGSSSVTSSNAVLGDIRQYSGDFGIGNNPESFAVNDNRKYFADVPSGSVMRLSSDGMTEINKYGMEDFFRDEFKQISPEDKRFVVDVTWTPPWSSTTNTITVGGENIDSLDIGMSVEGIDGENGLYIVNLDNETSSSIDITLNRNISNINSPQPSVIQCIKIVRDRVVGGYDNNYDNYVLSIVYNPPSRSSQSTLVSEPVEDEFNPEA